MVVCRPAVAAAVLLTWVGVSAQEQNEQTECGSGATAAAVVFAILFLLCLAALGFVLYKYVWKRRHCEYGNSITANDSPRLPTKTCAASPGPTA